jgi:hypothetical protein
MNTSDQINASLDQVQDWVESHQYRGYEPFDGLSSWLRPLAWKHPFLERLLMQSVRQSPINLRPWVGIQPQESTKGRGYMAAGYLLRHAVQPNAGFLDKARACLEWLDRHKVARFEHHSWSNHFDFVSRGGGYTRDDPIIVWTSLIGHAFLDAYDQTGEACYLAVAQSACNWIMELPRERTSSGDCLSYLADRQSSIHNANLLGAGLLARASAHDDRSGYRTVARSAMLYSCSRQQADGSWWYAEDPRYHWIDNFHTGYNLDSLGHYLEATGDETFLPHLQKGLAFFKSRFIEPNGRPKYYHTRAFPIDIQCAAQSIETLALHSSRDPDCLELAVRVAFWTIQNMQEPDGHFHYRHYPWMKARTAMLHWGQATMFKALALLQHRLAEPKELVQKPGLVAIGLGAPESNGKGVL